MPAYRPAQVPERIGSELVRKYHPHLLHADIKYVFRSTATKRGAQLVLGKARLVRGLTAFLGTGETDDEENPIPFFVIEIAEDTWQELTPRQQEALVDHELMHCAVDFSEKDNTPKLGIRPHDLKEFEACFERYGAWRPNLASFAAVMQKQQRPNLASFAAVMQKQQQFFDEVHIPAPAGDSCVDPEDVIDPELVEMLRDSPVDAARAAMNGTEPEPDEVPNEQESPVDENDLESPPIRIDPEPIPPEVIAAAKANSNGNGPKVHRFNPDDVDGPVPPEREKVTPDGRDAELQRFLGE